MSDTVGTSSRPRPVEVLRTGVLLLAAVGALVAGRAVEVASQQSATTCATAAHGDTTWVPPARPRPVAACPR